MEEYGIAAFRSRQQVLRFEEMLRRSGLMVSVVSTPREVAVGCGLSVKFRAGDIRRVQSMLSYIQPANLIGLYLVRRREGRTYLTTISRQG